MANHLATLSSQQVEAIAGEFISTRGFQFAEMRSGEYNNVYLFSTDEGSFAFRTRQKSARRDLESTAYEAEFMNKLSEARMPVHVPKNYRTRAGHLLFETDEASYNLQSCVPGTQRFNSWYETKGLALADVSEMFTALAYLHNAARTFSMTGRKTSPTLFDRLERFRKNLLDVGAIPPDFAESVRVNQGFLIERLDTLEKNLHDLHYDALPIYPVHYDLNITNVLWEAGRVVSVIDFDWAQDATLSFDFARTVMLSCGTFTEAGENQNRLQTDRLQAALHAYNAVAETPMTDADMLRTVLDMASFFIANWALEMSRLNAARESFFNTIYLAGIDRLRDTNRL